MNFLVPILASLALLQGGPAPASDATIPVGRPDAGWQARHQAMNERAGRGAVDLAFIGDSITHAFGGEPYTGDSFANRGADTWRLFYGDRRAINLGISGDRTQQVIWRLRNGNLDGISPKVAVIMIGTNNVGANTAPEIAAGVGEVCRTVRAKCPATRILLLGIFPRGAPDSAERKKLAEANDLLAAWAKPNRVTFLDIGKVFLDAAGNIPDDVMPDKLHPFALGYRMWAMAMEPTLARLLGRKPLCTDDPTNQAVVPVTQQRDNYNWLERHQQVLDYVGGHKVRLAFIGDSITHAWAGPPASPDRDAGHAAWDRHFAARNGLNMGFGWDRTENVMWRLEQGELTGANPEAVVLMIGTNNLGLNTPEQIRDGIGGVIARIQATAPRARILLLAIFPRGPRPDDPMRLKAKEVNELLPALARKMRVEYADIGAGFLEPDGTITQETMPDYLHLTPKGYETWATAIEPILDRLMAKRRAALPSLRPVAVR